MAPGFEGKALVHPSYRSLLRSPCACACTCACACKAERVVKLEFRDRSVVGRFVPNLGAALHPPSPLKSAGIYFKGLKVKVLCKGL